ncbi:MAG: hypothetical protein ACJAV2_000319 [Myxococcota bacterium]|jgi:hypothetical protein
MVGFDWHSLCSGSTVSSARACFNCPALSTPKNQLVPHYFPTTSGPNAFLSTLRRLWGALAAAQKWNASNKAYAACETLVRKPGGTRALLERTPSLAVREYTPTYQPSFKHPRPGHDGRSSWDETNSAQWKGQSVERLDCHPHLKFGVRVETIWNGIRWVLSRYCLQCLVSQHPLTHLTEGQ